ncbi:hypothetical protein PsYK624_167280 [Phanerochaete sordida]|uniref:Uncharacterized protein n=1 Tax=Phanerochaete sordida TaxID=48140 RepID=A0A9P3GTH7_9APHY|nr:hypothetical protein PsYK624_167280 [Phanerochaete sordida]
MTCETALLRPLRPTSFARPRPITDLPQIRVDRRQRAVHPAATTSLAQACHHSFSARMTEPAYATTRCASTHTQRQTLSSLHSLLMPARGSMQARQPNTRAALRPFCDDAPQPPPRPHPSRTALAARQRSQRRPRPPSQRTASYRRRRTTPSDRPR